MTKLVSGLLFLLLSFSAFSAMPKYRYEYKERDHTYQETLKHIGFIYGITWAIYPLTQPDTVFKEGSFTKYRHNFGQFVFDNDEPEWNWLIHPLSGSQLYLYYRAQNYSRIDSLALAVVSSTLFEMTVEIYTEPASIQDLYQTPVLGSVLGLGLENLSMYLLKSEYGFVRFWGHIINPTTFLGLFEGKVRTVPVINKDKTAVQVNFEF